MQNEQIMVTVAHVRAANFCARGARQWFARKGLDYNEFLARGLPIGQIEAVGDAMSELVVKRAREAHAGEDE